jgi:hypothetical protein
MSHVGLHGSKLLVALLSELLAFFRFKRPLKCLNQAVVKRCMRPHRVFFMQSGKTFLYLVFAPPVKLAGIERVYHVASVHGVNAYHF